MGFGQMPVSMPAVMRIGDIEITPMSVRTPLTEFPLRGSTWMTQDQVVTSQRTPTWAVVLAIVGFCVLTIFSLLFLLAKETVFQGAVIVTVTNGRSQHTTMIPVNDAMGVKYVHDQVNYVRAMACG